MKRIFNFAYEQGFFKKFYLEPKKFKEMFRIKESNKFKEMFKKTRVSKTHKSVTKISKTLKIFAAVKFYD